MRAHEHTKKKKKTRQPEGERRKVRQTHRQKDKLMILIKRNEGILDGRGEFFFIVAEQNSSDRQKEPEERGERETPSSNMKDE